MRSKTIHAPVVLLLLLLFIVACGRRGDPVAIEPYKEVGVVDNLRASIVGDNLYLSWGYPDVKTFPKKALKGFVVFRAEMYPGETLENCDCKFRSLDFIVAEKQKDFEYLDKKALRTQSYVYKIVVMDKNNRMGKASNIVVVKGIEHEPEKVLVLPEAPKGIIAVYTQKSVVITWDEIKTQKIKFYRIYRSEGEDFLPIGESATPAFTDRTVEGSKKYFYRITAVADREGPPSEEIEIIIKMYTK
jgi:hypothetical protein